MGLKVDDTEEGGALDVEDDVAFKVADTEEVAALEVEGMEGGVAFGVEAIEESVTTEEYAPLEGEGVALEAAEDVGKGVALDGTTVLDRESVVIFVPLVVIAIPNSKLASSPSSSAQFKLHARCCSALPVPPDAINK